MSLKMKQEISSEYLHDSRQAAIKEAIAKDCLRRLSRFHLLAYLREDLM